MKFIFILPLFLLVSCKGKTANTLVKKPVVNNLVMVHVTAGDLQAAGISGLFAFADAIELRLAELLGKTIPNDDDSTLLCLVYGSCYFNGEEYVFNKGPQIWREDDSVYMKVEERLGDSLMQVIYIRGEGAITSVMHDHYNETVLLLNKVGEGWKITDAVIDGHAIDYQNVVMSDTTFGEYKIIKYTTFGTYASGVMYGAQTYMLVLNEKLNVISADLMFHSSNTASGQCFAVEGEETQCNCYSNNLVTQFHVDTIKKCLVFECKGVAWEAGCNQKDSSSFPVSQTWYMNEKNVFQVAGNVYSDTNFDRKPMKKMSGREIKDALK